MTTTIPRLIDEAARRFADREALVDDGVRLTFADLGDRVRQVAASLIASGIAPGDRVAIWAPNVPEWVTAALGTHYAGTVLVPINTRFKGAEAADILRRSGARLLFTVTGFLDGDYIGMLAEQAGLEALTEIVVIDGAVPHDCTGLDDFLRRTMPPSAVADRAAAVAPADTCHILFTSGTTGVPKGVVLEHGPVCAVYDTLGRVFEFEAGDRQLVVLPFFHSFGLHVGVLCSLIYGMTILPHLVFEPEAIMRRIATDRVTSFPGPPAIFQAMLANPLVDELDLSSLDTITIGASSVPPGLVREIAQRLGVRKILTGYGLTESSGTVSLTRAGDPPEILADTDGIPIDGVEVRVVDESSVSCEVGTTGEVLVRGYNVMRCYLDDADATAETIDADGWLHTGDVGHVRDDGYLVITDRKKDMYDVGGFNAYPAEIEAMLVEHPAIAQVAVIGIPDDRLGEVGMAFVIVAPGASPSTDELIAWARERMANYKVPRVVRFVDDLPLNATGKVLKNQLRASAQDS